MCSSDLAIADWSVAHLRARQAARVTCAVARAAAGRLEGEERVRLWDQIERIDPIW